MQFIYGVSAFLASHHFSRRHPCSIPTNSATYPSIVYESALFSQSNDGDDNFDLDFSSETFSERVAKIPLAKPLRNRIRNRRKKDAMRGSTFKPKKKPKLPPLTARRRRVNEVVDDDKNQFLSDSIDSFLAGDYAHPFSPDAAAPHPLLTAGETVDVSLRALRQLNDPYPFHGAAVFLRFCMPLTRGERWGGGDPWKDLLRSSLTPSMLARNLRASPLFSCLLDWTSLDVTEGVSNPNHTYFITGSQNDITYVNAGLFFEAGSPTIAHFVLKKMGTTWFIDSVFVGMADKVWFSKMDDEEFLDL
ncbi:hypothetical protein HJC23_004159 [Cyclotella cryptica]|uniref:Uncharacterized protein n=1 Tax=Cyclotella cryptica TaxID=29204 RepID=A0ABD3NXR3_9STRA|eukprot:CCRYP_018970-RA/>CCRYP_018970-RA protein AED:0.26 eAED:0.26 QI:0/-1/0/1/-1/1/1/0/303